MRTKISKSENIMKSEERILEPTFPSRSVETQQTPTCGPARPAGRAERPADVSDAIDAGCLASPNGRMQKQRQHQEKFYQYLQGRRNSFIPVALACCFLFTFALPIPACAAGEIVAWGQNNAGECNVPSPNTDFTAIASGGAQSLGLKEYQSENPATNCVSSPSGLVSWWRAEGDAIDALGTNNGVFEGGVEFAPGEVGQAFVFNTANADVKMAASSSLDVGTGDGFTVELWIAPADVAVRGPLVEWNNGSGTWGVHFWNDPGQPFQTRPGTRPGPGNLYANIVDRGGGWHPLSSGGGTITNDVFQHVALTYDKASGVATIYCNGAIVAEQGFGTFTPLTSYDLYLGRRISGAPGDLGTFNGLIDEAALYNRALSQSEIQAIYNAGSSGKCVPAPVLPMPLPVITAFSPASGVPGTTVTLTGDNFSSVPSNNIVYFGAVRATVTAASVTNLIVTAPVSATYAPITVTVN